MQNNDDDFLIEGICRVADIVGTIDAFQKRMTVRIMGILRNRKDWSPLSVRIKDIEKRFVLSMREPWLSAWVNGTFNRDPINATMGIWWNSPSKTPYILYAGVWNVATNKTLFRAGRDLPESIGVLDNQWLYLALPQASTTVDLDRDFTRLMDAVLEDLKTQPLRRGRK